MLTTEICQYVLSRGSVRVGILDLGATVSFMEMPDRFGRMKNIVAGFARSDDYWQNDLYFGCIVGRYANRMVPSPERRRPGSWQCRRPRYSYRAAAPSTA